MPPVSALKKVHHVAPMRKSVLSGVAVCDYVIKIHRYTRFKTILSDLLSCCYCVVAGKLRKNVLALQRKQREISVCLLMTYKQTLNLEKNCALLFTNAYNVMKPKS